MLYKFCRCGKKILIEEKFCAECKSKEEIYKKERYKKYQNSRKDKKEQQFYNSKEWKSKREFVLSKYNYIDIYAYYTDGTITVSDTVHHIVEIKEDYNKRLEVLNLFCCSKESHKLIHEKYFTDKEKCIEELMSMLLMFREEFNINI